MNLRGGQNMNFAVSVEYLPAMMAMEPQAVQYADLMRVLDETPSPRRASRPSSTTAERDFAPEIDLQFASTDSTTRSLGFVPMGTTQKEYLAQGRANEHPVDLERTDVYILRAFCDNDCSQLDLSLTDAQGNVIARYSGTDDAPFLTFEGKRGRYYARVTMTSCGIPPCAYGIRIFERPSSP
jgi:hypothetical protein